MKIPIDDEIISRFGRKITTIDSHTAGEPTRFVVGGIDPLPGETMKEKRLYFMEHYDHLRKRLTREPRGHRDMFTIVLTDPVTEGAAFGLIYMDPRRYPFLCGHATIASVSNLIDIGKLEVKEGLNEIILDTPSGPMVTKAVVVNGKTESVTLQMVPSFVHKTGEKITVPEVGEIEVETVCVGGFFVMVNAGQIDIDLIPQNSVELKRLGMTIIDVANEQLTVSHPERPEVKTVDVVEFYEDDSGSASQHKGIVIYGEAHMDRSPCGTGTTAKMTLLHHLGKIELNESYINAGPLGTTFEGKLVSETRIGNRKAVIAEIRGSAQITGFHSFILDKDDPFPEGFLV